MPADRPETCPYCMQRADRCACEDPRIVGYENAPPTPPAPAMRHWQHDETGRVCDCVDCPGPRYHEVNEAFAEAHEKAMREKCGTPAPADETAWLLEMADQSHLYLVEGRPGHPAHMTSDPWKAARFKTREAAALKFAMIGTGTLAALGIPNDLRPVEHGFAQPARADDASGAEAMREAAAALLDGYAKNAEALAETEPEEGYEDRREEFREKAALLRAGATQIRHLPLPARDDAGGAEAMGGSVPAAQYRAVVRAFDALARGDLRALGTVHEDIQGSVDAIVARLRSLPLPARDDAVEEAAEALLDAMDAREQSDGRTIRNMERLRAALRRAKGGSGG